MLWLILAVLLVLLLLIPVGVSAQYTASGIHASLKIGFVRFTLFPAKVRSSKDVRSDKSKDEQLKKATGNNGKPSDNSLADYFPIIRLVLDFLLDFKQKIRVDNLEFKLVLAGSDPCDVAVNYGRAWMLAGNLMPIFERVFLIKRKSINIDCDFVAPKSSCSGKIELSITVAQILQLLGFHGLRILYNYLKIFNKRKGGARA